MLDQMYKLHVCPQKDDGHIVYHIYASKFSIVLAKRLEQVQYAVSFDVTEELRGTSKQKLYDELEWESFTRDDPYMRDDACARGHDLETYHSFKFK